MTPLVALLILAGNAPKVRPVPVNLGLSPFYKKYVNLDGLPIVGSEKVPDRALQEAYGIGKEMLRNIPKAREAMIRNKVRIAIMAASEQTLDIPEHSDLQKAFPETDWNKRARGLGATKERPAISAAEENLLGYENDRYKGENIFIHEFSHAIADMGLADSDKTFMPELNACYRNAVDTGLWKNTYAISNPSEYWAEGVQSYFNANRTSTPPNGIHNDIGTREKLETYDPKLYTLIRRVFPTKWTWSGPPKV